MSDGLASSVRHYRQIGREAAKAIRQDLGLTIHADPLRFHAPAVIRALAAEKALYVVLGNFRGEEDGSAKALVEHGRAYLNATLEALGVAS